jgi:hypothetical protein
LSIFGKISIFIGILLFTAICVFVICLASGTIVVDESGEISVPFLSNPTPLPLDPGDPITGAYLSIDDSTVCRFYGNGSYVFTSLIHPSVSFGQWGSFGNGHYKLYLSFTESDGKTNYANSLQFDYTLGNGVLSGSGSESYRKISGNPDEIVQAHAYPTTSAQTPINRQVGVEVKRVSSDSIYVKVITGKDVSSLVSISVLVNGKEATMTDGKISPNVGSMAYYRVNENTNIVVVAEFYDYSRFNVWAGKI